MILRDPVHGLIAFETEEEALVVRLLECAEVQRLRRIRQLGVTSLAFPGAEHSRFSHAIGTAHVMKRLLARLREVEDGVPSPYRITQERAKEALAAALLHDVGHGPLSHLFEDAVPGAPPHEAWTTRILLDPSSEVHRILVAEGATMPGRVAALVEGRSDLPYLARAVSGTLDVDRCDYLLRDAHATGVRYGEYDLDWLLRSIQFAPPLPLGGAPGLAIDGTKGIVALEAFVLARLFMFQQVYFHKATRAGEWMIGRILARASALVRSGTHLPAPAALVAAISGAPVALDDYLELDDGVLLGTLHGWEGAEDPVLADLCRKIRRRELFKTWDLDARAPETWPAALETARALAIGAGLDPDAYVGLDVPSDVPFADRDDPLSVVIASGATKKPGDVSLLLGRLRDESVVRPRLVFTPELRDGIRAAFSA